MTKSREEYAAEGFLIIASRTAERRERERKEKQERSAPASSTGIDPSGRQYETHVADPAATAAAIIAAGKRRRNESDAATPSPSARPAANLAAQIILAGKRRRGEV